MRLDMKLGDKTRVDIFLNRMAPEVVVTETCKDDPYDYKVNGLM